MYFSIYQTTMIWYLRTQRLELFNWNNIDLALAYGNFYLKIGFLWYLGISVYDKLQVRQCTYVHYKSFIAYFQLNLKYFFVRKIFNQILYVFHKIFSLNWISMCFVMLSYIFICSCCTRKHLQRELANVFDFDAEKEIIFHLKFANLKFPLRIYDNYNS
jgi:hypothetical protein